MGDTAPIRAEEQFDTARVAAWLRKHLPHLVGDAPIEFDQFPSGAANLTYRAVAGPFELVLRRAPLGPVARGGHDMAREHRVLSRLWSEFAMAPRAYGYCEDPEIMGKPFFVMERRHGYVVRHAWPEQLEAADRRRTTESLVQQLALLHGVDPAAVDLDDLGHPDGFVERQVEGWWRRWEAAKTRDLATMETVYRRLQASIPQPQTVALLHNDYKLDNTMIGDDGNLVAVFDWDMATRGDPLVDLGTLLAYWPDPDGIAFTVFSGRIVPLTPIMTKREVAARYADSTGLDLEVLPFYEALGLYRIAVILEQIYARYAAGQTTDQRFAAFAPAAGLMADAALAVLDSAGR